MVPPTLPPRVARGLLSIVLPIEDRRFVLADLAEDFAHVAATQGLRVARRRYRAQVSRSLIPGLTLRVKRLRERRRHRVIRISSSTPHKTDRRGHQPTRHTIVELFSDLRHALRTATRTPLATTVIVLSLGLGIGATTFVFSVTDALLFRGTTLGEHGDELVSVYTSGADGNLYGGNSFPDFQSLATNVPSLRDAAAVRFGAMNMGDERPSRRLFAEIVTGNYFDVLGIRLPLGRSFSPDESRIGTAARVAVISHRLWQDQFGGGSDVLGKTTRLDGKTFEIIGVAPAGMVSRLLSLNVDVWVPLGIPGGTFRATPRSLENRGDRDFLVIAHLPEGVPLRQAQTETSVLGDRLSQTFPHEWQTESGDARVFTVIATGESNLPPPMKAALSAVSGLLFGVAAMILLIACSNIAGIFLARANQRRREMAVRAALGAGRSRLMTLLLVESLVPGLIGGGLGVVFTIAATRSLGRVHLPIGVPIEFGFVFDIRLLLFATVVSIGASIAFGLVPAIHASRPDQVAALKSVAGTAGNRPGRFGLRNILVVTQVTLSLVLLIGSGIAVRALQAATSVDLGFDTARIALMSKQMTADTEDDAQIVLAARTLVDDLSAHPDVESVHVTRAAEGTFLGSLNNTEIQTTAAAANARATVNYNSVSPNYLETIQVRVLRGRTIRELDVAGAVPAAVVTEAFVQKFFPGTLGLGQRFTTVSRRAGGDLTGEPNRTLEIVGVVADGHYADLQSRNEPFFWEAFYQSPTHHPLIVVKGRRSATEMLQLLKSNVPLTEDDPTLVTPATLEEMVSMQTAAYRIIGKVLGSAGVFGLVLVLVGIYGVVSLAVTARTREMAIHQAIGATRRHVVRIVAREGIALSLFGTVLGMGIAGLVSRVLESTVVGVSALDPLAFGLPVAVLLLASIVASHVPARRITRPSLMQILRDE